MMKPKRNYGIYRYASGKMVFQSDSSALTSKEWARLGFESDDRYEWLGDIGGMDIGVIIAERQRLQFAA